MARASYYLGVDSVGYEERLVLLEATEDDHRVQAAATVPPGGDLVREVRAMHKRLAGVTGTVGLRDAAIRILTLPPTTDENMERVVRLEAEGALPMGAEELALAHHVMGMTQQSRIEVMLAAAKQDAVVSLVSKLNPLQSPPPRVGVTSVAVMNALQSIEGAERAGICATVRIEDDVSELLVLDKARVLTAQSLPNGCAVLAAVNAPELEPEPAPVRGGGVGVAERAFEAGGVEEASAPGWVAALASGLRYSLRALSYERGIQIEVLYLCGKGAALAGVAEQLQERLSMPVRLLSPPGIEEDAPRYAVAYGAALQAAGRAPMPLHLELARILAQREVEQRRQSRFSWTVLLTSAVLAILVLVAVLTIKKQLDLNAAREAYQEVSDVHVAAVASPAMLSRAQKAVAEELDVRLTSAELLRMLNLHKPAGAWLTEVTYNASTGAVIRAYAVDPNAATQLQVNLLRERVFDEVTLDYRNAEVIANQPVWAFQISGKLRPRESRRRVGGAR